MESLWDQEETFLQFKQGPRQVAAKKKSHKKLERPLRIDRDSVSFSISVPPHAGAQIDSCLKQGLPKISLQFHCLSLKFHVAFSTLWLILTNFLIPLIFKDAERIAYCSRISFFKKMFQEKLSTIHSPVKVFSQQRPLCSPLKRNRLSENITTFEHRF